MGAKKLSDDGDSEDGDISAWALGTGVPAIQIGTYGVAGLVLSTLEGMMGNGFWWGCLGASLLGWGWIGGLYRQHRRQGQHRPQRGLDV